jgi:hypothetical protein
MAKGRIVGRVMSTVVGGIEDQLEQRAKEHRATERLARASAEVLEKALRDYRAAFAGTVSESEATQAPLPKQQRRRKAAVQLPMPVPEERPLHPPYPCAIEAECPDCNEGVDRDVVAEAKRSKAVAQ